MCGINGYVQFANIISKNEIFARIKSMNNFIIHRGPDDEGIFVDDFVGLGMRRLSIIDLSSGRQPIYNEDKSMVIIFNGELYNYKTLQETLKYAGHNFRTQSDTEVVLHAYEQYGERCLQYFDGMFAFAIYDLQEGSVFIARDLAGEKPLYYFSDNYCFMFASELKSLIGTGRIEKKVNELALCQYFQLTYIPAPLTIFENIYKLESGHFMKINLNGTVVSSKYWDITYDNRELIKDYNQCKKLLRDAVYRSVETRMIADVPIGAFLSGGIDSSTIVGVMSQVSSKPINTFTVGFKVKEYDESDRAQIVADYWKTNHHIYYLDYEEVLGELDSILNNMDEPFADSSAIPTFAISKYARKHVKVVLTGDAGDELFAGYSKYLIGYYCNMYNKIPDFVRKQIFEKIVYAVPDTTSITRKVRKVIENSRKELFSQRKDLMCLGFKDEELQLLLNRHMGQNDLHMIKKYYDRHLNTDEISKTLYLDFKVVLEGDMLPKVDRMSMLASLETRVPLLAKEVLELAARIPSGYKINKRNQKIIFKDTFRDIIPAKLLEAPKSGFGVPIDYWFRGPLKQELSSLIDKDYINAQGIFNYSYINSVFHEHLRGIRNRKSELWALYVFQRWFRRYFSV